MRRISSFCQSNSLSFCPTSLPSGTKQTVSMNSMTSAPVTLSSFGRAARLRLATATDLPRPERRRPRYLWAGRSRYHARTRSSAQLTQQVSDGLRRRTVHSDKLASVFAGVPALGPQLSQPRFPPLRARSLRNQPAEHNLPGGVDPVRRQRGDDLTPNPLLERIELGGWIRATLTGDEGDDD